MVKDPSYGVTRTVGVEWPAQVFRVLVVAVAGVRARSSLCQGESSGDECLRV